MKTVIATINGREIELTLTVEQELQIFCNDSLEEVYEFHGLIKKEFDEAYKMVPDNIKALALERMIAEIYNKLYQQKDFPIHAYVDVTRHFEEIFSPKPNPVEKIISEIQVLDNRGFHKNAMSKLNSFIFELYLEENIKEVNFLISYFLNGEFSIELLITLARISKPHREKLSNRSSLIEVLENRLKEECTIIEAKNILFHVS
jgi:hypothetical protein